MGWLPLEFRDGIGCGFLLGVVTVLSLVGVAALVLWLARGYL